ncbi:MAG TPA: hypothetical protein PLL10_09400 [Elusimicrobiales bacterium]|nr:hypothetical protein [Elusimicrobiales bacterium]
MDKLQLVFNRPKKVAAAIDNAIRRGTGPETHELEKLAVGGMK